MTISLPPELQKLVDQKVREGAYSSPEEVVYAAIARFFQDGDDFNPGELDALLAVGTADIEQRRVYPGDAVFDEIRRASEALRQGKAR